jgi:hypothetical protein
MLQENRYALDALPEEAMLKQIRQQVLLQINGSMRALLRQAQLAGLCI